MVVDQHQPIVEKYYGAGRWQALSRDYCKNVPSITSLMNGGRKSVDEAESTSPSTVPRPYLHLVALRYL